MATVGMCVYVFIYVDMFVYVCICSLSNSNYFTSAKKCRRESYIMDFTWAKMEFGSAIFKKLSFSKSSIERYPKQNTSIQKLV